MPLVLMIAGLVVTLVGAFLMARPVPEPVVARGAIEDLAALLKEINALLDKFDKRFRPGLILMIVGLALIGLGVYLETTDAKDAAEAAALLLLS